VSAETLPLLEGLPWGTVVLRGERPEGWNARACALLPGLDRGDLPQAVRDLLAHSPEDREGAAVCTLEGRHCQATLSRAAGGLRLLTLVPLAETLPVEPGQLGGQLREQLGELRLALEALAPVVEAEGGPDSRRNFSVLNRNFYRLLRMTRHLELAADLKGAAGPAQALDLAQLCAALTEETDLLARQGGVTLCYESRLTVLPAVGSRRLLRVLLLNLLSNAIKAAGRGGGVKLSLARFEDRGVITVTDNGKAPAEAGGLFRPAEGPMKPGEGLGLGLSLARQIALLHRGTILTVRGAEETRVTVSLPLEGERPVRALRTPRRDEEGDFPDVLVELADALPAQVYDLNEL
jgi:hypothetical protein